MNICIAQIQSERGNIQSNIECHKQWIARVITNNADFIFFPELSLTSYEPTLAHTLATAQNDPRLDDFQQLSNLHNIGIGIGMPTRSPSGGIRISMVLFQANKARQTYSKQYLHSDELPYFEQGQEQIVVNIHDNSIAPAICYESLQEEHVEKAVALGATLYAASVAKSQRGIHRAYEHYPRIAKTYAIPVLMSNCIGYCDNFESAGQSAVWNKSGVVIAQLSGDSEGLLMYNTETDAAVTI